MTNDASPRLEDAIWVTACAERSGTCGYSADERMWHGASPRLEDATITK